ncbi:MAG: hypothetical protein AAB511_03225 [Patescibacteria group bacterium]
MMNRLIEFYTENKKVTIVSGAFLLLLIIFLLLSSGSKTPPASTSLSPTAGGLVSELSLSPVDVAGGRELLSVLTELQSISLDGAIFLDPVFSSLKDWSLPLDPQPFAKALGRRNPFSEPVR